MFNSKKISDVGLKIDTGYKNNKAAFAADNED